MGKHAAGEKWHGEPRWLQITSCNFSLIGAMTTIRLFHVLLCHVYAKHTFPTEYFDYFSIASIQNGEWSYCAVLYNVDLNCVKLRQFYLLSALSQSTVENWWKLIWFCIYSIITSILSGSNNSLHVACPQAKAMFIVHCVFSAAVSAQAGTSWSKTFGQLRRPGFYDFLCWQFESMLFGWRTRTAYCAVNDVKCILRI